MSLRLIAPVAVVIAMKAVPAAAQGDEDSGMAAFLQNCSACHSIQANVHKQGPSLAGIVGRTAGSTSGFDFSAALRDEDFVWSEATLFEYLSVPTQTGGGDETLVHGVAMKFGAMDVKAVENVIACRWAFQR